MLTVDNSLLCIEAEDSEILEVLRSDKSLILPLPGVGDDPVEVIVVVTARAGRREVFSATYGGNRRSIKIFPPPAAEVPEAGYRGTLKTVIDFWEDFGFKLEPVKINYAKAMREVVIRAIPVIMSPLALRKMLDERGRAQNKLTRKDYAASSGEQFSNGAADSVPSAAICEAEEVASQEDAAARKQAEEAARKQAEEAARKQAEEAVRKQAEEAARKQAEEAARKQAEEAARKQAEEAARKQAEDVARKQAEEAARKQAEDVARKQAAEAARKQAEEATRKQAEEAARKQAEEAARKQTEVARRQAEEVARRQAEEVARKQAEEAARKQAEEVARKQAEEAARKQAEEAARKQAEEAARKQAEEAARKKSEKTARKQAEETKRKQTAAAPLKSAADETPEKTETSARSKAREAAWQQAEAARKEAEEAARRLTPQERAALILERESKEAKIRVMVDEAAALLLGGSAGAGAERASAIPGESFSLVPGLESLEYGDPAEIAEVYISLSMVVLSPENYPQQHCSAYICTFHRQGKVELYVVLRLKDSRCSLFYAPRRQPANMGEYRQLAAAAVRFLEVTGFLVEMTPLGATPEERKKTLSVLPFLRLKGS